jgi:hypothetical protein
MLLLWKMNQEEISASTSLSPDLSRKKSIVFDNYGNHTPNSPTNSGKRKNTQQGITTSKKRQKKCLEIQKTNKQGATQLFSLSSPPPPSFTDLIYQRLHALQKSLISGVITIPFINPAIKLDFKKAKQIFQVRCHLMIRLAAVSFTNCTKKNDFATVETLDSLLCQVCKIQYSDSTSLNQLSIIIAETAKINIRSGIAKLPNFASSVENIAFNNLQFLCKTGGILEKMCSHSESLTSLRSQATQLMLYIYLDSISERPMLRNKIKRKKAMISLQLASLKLRSKLRVMTAKIK